MEDIILKAEDVQKLLAGANGDAALLYLCGKTDTPPERVGLDGTRLETAAAFLRRVGLWELPAPRYQQSNEPPAYSEADITRALSDTASEFRKLVADTQRRLGRVLSTQDLKILLSMRDYLGLPNEVISILITYCIDRCRARGSSRNPTLRTVEQEAYRWADEGIDCPEAACAYVMANTANNARVRPISQLLGLGNRTLTQREEQYILSWLGLGFGADAIGFAYEKTCINTGQLKWPYMNSILNSWHSQGLHTLDEIQQNDRPAQKSAAKKSDYQQHGAALSPMMQQAVKQLLSDEEADKEDKEC